MNLEQDGMLLDQQNDDERLFNESLKTGPHGGSSINNLKQQALQQLQQQQQSQPSPQFQNPQYSPQYQPEIIQTPRSVKKVDDKKIISRLVNEINSSFVNKSDKDDTETETDIVDIDEEGANIFSSGFTFVKESILITIMYIILSQDFIKKTIGKYIPQILQSDNVVGFIIYGGILALMIGLAKNILKIK